MKTTNQCDLCGKPAVDYWRKKNVCASCMNEDFEPLKVEDFILREGPLAEIVDIKKDDMDYYRNRHKIKRSRHYVRGSK